MMLYTGLQYNKNKIEYKKNTQLGEETKAVYVHK